MLYISAGKYLPMFLLAPLEFGDENSRIFRNVCNYSAVIQHNISEDYESSATALLQPQIQEWLIVLTIIRQFSVKMISQCAAISASNRVVVVSLSLSLSLSLSVHLPPALCDVFVGYTVHCHALIHTEDREKPNCCVA